MPKPLIALQILHHLERKRDDYEEECESYAKDGYRPHYCEHGANLWVDYDVICGYCEEGWHLSNPIFIRSRAIELSKQFRTRITSLNTAYLNLKKLVSFNPQNIEALDKLHNSAFDQICKEFGVMQ
jgi:hypothetical protein